MQTKIGVTSDGFWGQKSIAACQKYLRGLMPKPNPWPKAGQASVKAFYGEPGDEANLVTVDVSAYGVRYSGKKVNTLRCHRKVRDSLLRVFAELAKTSPEILALYDGCFNFRKMRGGSLWSMHSWGIAVDFDAGNNGNNTSWPTKATMPFKVMEAFAREGWTSAGAFWGRDAMHAEATS